MPIKPRKNETEEEWMARCVPEMINPAPGRPDKRPREQAVAICLDIWQHRNDKKEASMTSIIPQPQKAPPPAENAHPVGNDFTLMPDEGESQQGFMDRCTGDGHSADACQGMWDACVSNHMSGESIRTERAYSLLDIKSLNEDQRIIRGMATTPTPDRMGDIVEPLGAKFKNPLPLLWQHDTKQPIGKTSLGKPTKNGIPFEARIAKTNEPGTLKDRLDEAWQSVKLDLVKGVSIGFKSLETSFMKDGGIHFIETELLELSLVTIPANAEATIETIKAFDNADEVRRGVVTPNEARSAAGLKPIAGGDDVWGNTPKPVHAHVDRLQVRSDSDVPLPPEVKGGKGWTTGLKPIAGGAKQPGAIKQTAASAVKKEVKKMTIQEQITAFEAKRAALVASMDALMSKAADAGQTLDAEESKEYDDAEVEVTQIDTHLKRLHAREKINRETAKPVTEVTSVQAGSEVRSRSPIISVKANVPKGTAFTRYCMSLMASQGNRWEAQQIAKQWEDQTPEVCRALETDIPKSMSNPDMILKAAVGAGTTTDATWASPLIAYTVMASEFIELLRPATIIGRVPGLRQVPFNIQMPRATAGSTMGWVGENAPKPVSNMAFDTVQLRWAKAAGIVVMTNELVRFSNPAAEAIVRGDMTAAMAQFLDRQFVDPSVAAVTNVSPASITNGVSGINASGTNQAAFVTDAKTLLNLFLTNNLSTVGGVWIMSQRQALAFSLMLNALGQPFYPNISANGGTLLGYPVITSENIPSVGGSPADGTPIIFAVAPEILLADDGQVVIDASNQASVNMDSAPDSPPSGTTILVSLWQMNMVGLRAERWINWLKRRSTAVQYIINANYA